MYCELNTRTNNNYRASCQIYYTMSTIDVVKKVFTQGSDWQDKEQFLDVIYWGRQILGIILGLIWGLVPLKGFIGLVLFAALSAGIVYVWFTAVQGVDESEFGGAWELTKEGFLTSAAGFLVTWIIIYTGLHIQ